MGYLEGFAVTIRQHRLFGGDRVTTEYSGGRRAKRIRKSLRHVRVGEVGGLPEFDLRGSDVDAQIRTQPLPHAVDEQAANVVHVQVGQHHVGHGREIDAGGFQSLDQPPGPRQVQVRVRPEPRVDEHGPAAATHHDRV